MAITNEVSAEAAIEAAGGVGRLSDASGGGKVHLAYFSFTQGAAAGDANSTADLRKLPPGRVRIVGSMSHIAFSAFGAARTLDIGYTAYVDEDGETVAAVVDALVDGADVSAAGSANMSGNPLLESRAGVTVQAKVLGGTIPAGATLEGVIAYCIG